MTKFYFLLETTDQGGKRKKKNADGTHKAHCNLVKHQARQHDLWKSRAHATTVGTEDSQATVTVTTPKAAAEAAAGSPRKIQIMAEVGGRLGCSQGVAAYLLHVLNQELSQRAEIPGIMGKLLERQGSKPMKILDTILGD